MAQENCHQPLRATQMMYDLTALKHYENYLNSMVSDLGIREWHKLDLITQCLIAERWQSGVDVKADRENAEGQWV